MVKEEELRARLDELLLNVKQQSVYHLGYPYNLQPLYDDLRPFMDFFLNNLGDAYAQSNYGINTQDLEREVVDHFLEMWGGARQSDPLWGAVTSCGTEGNLLGILYGRTFCEAATPDVTPTLVSSVESHYSVPKAARMYRMPYERIASSDIDGELDYAAFGEACKRIVHGEGGSVVCVVNVGSTVRGAHDRLPRMLEALDKARVPRSKRFMHCDAALSGLILPVISEAEEWHFGFDKGADAIAVSGHKQLGTPVPCGDSTIAGSRSGFAALALWYTIERRGLKGLERDARECIAKSRWLVEELERKCGARARATRCNPFSTTVVFARPSPALERKYQLATTGDIAHVVVTPSVTEQVLDLFVEEYASELYQAHEITA